MEQEKLVRNGNIFPGTLKEINDVTSLLRKNGQDFELWTKDEATEERFKGLNEKVQKRDAYRNPWILL